MRRALGLLLLAAALVSCTTPGAPESTDTGSAIVLGWRQVPGGPSLDLPSGAPIEDVAWDRGKPWTLINFWASTCGPCRQEIPTLNRALAADVQVLGVSRDRFEKYAREFEEEVGAEFPSWMDPDGEYAANFAQHLPVEMLPTSALLKKGRLVAVHVGPIEELDGLEQTMRAVDAT